MAASTRSLILSDLLMLLAVRAGAAEKRTAAGEGAVLQRKYRHNYSMKKNSGAATQPPRRTLIPLLKERPITHGPNVRPKVGDESMKKAEAQ